MILAYINNNNNNNNLLLLLLLLLLAKNDENIIRDIIVLVIYVTALRALQAVLVPEFSGSNLSRVLISGTREQTYDLNALLSP